MALELVDAHGEAMREFDRLTRQVADDQWDAPTPCTEWTVRDLVNHLVYEQLWALHLLRGETVEQVGDRYDGDVLGDDPVAAWDAAASTARAALTGLDPLDRPVHVSFGQIPAEEYGWQLTTDLAVHGWDLAAALGVGNPIGGQLAGRLLDEVRPQVENWSGAGIFAKPVPVPDETPAPDRLVALLGRNPAWSPPRR